MANIKYALLPTKALVVGLLVPRSSGQKRIALSPAEVWGPCGSCGHTRYPTGRNSKGPSLSFPSLGGG